MTGIRCGGPELAEYAVGRLPLDRSRLWDRHLIVCRHCAVQVQGERRLHDSLIAAPTPSSTLHAQLLAMAATMGGPSTGSRVLDREALPLAVPAVPTVPRPAHRHDALPLMAPSAPPVHRSALRSVVLASTVAGLGVTAVWSLTAIGGVGSDTGPANLPVAVIRTAADSSSVTPGAQPGTTASSTASPVARSMNSSMTSPVARSFNARPASWRGGTATPQPPDSTLVTGDRAESTP